MLIIFDCDGVLVDSERLAARVFSDVLAKIDVNMPADECFATFRGKTLDACYTWLEENKHITLPDSFAVLLETETQSNFEKQLCRVEGIELVLDYLMRKKIPFCVASNGSHKKILHSLKITKLLPYFEHRFSAQDVSFGKPKPDLFLYAAHKMNKIITETLVIEDSISGVRAAIAAGMDILHYGSPLHMLDTNVTNFTQMNELIKHIDNKFNSLTNN